jgi:hypothetical protein
VDNKFSCVVVQARRNLCIAVEVLLKFFGADSEEGLVLNTTTALSSKIYCQKTSNFTS